MKDLIVFVESLSHVWLFVISRTVVCQAPLSFTISWSLLKFISIESVMLSNHLIFCQPPLFSLQSFPASGSFPMSWLFTSGGQNIGASATVLPMNVQGWFPLGLIGLISLQSKGLSGVFSNTTAQKHHFFGIHPIFMVQLSHSYMTTGKTISLTIQTFFSKGPNLAQS